MNAIVSLCHFCENHGPSIVFCTQVIHPDSPLNDDHVKQSESSSHGEQINPTEKPSHVEQTHQTEKPSHGEQTHQTEKPSHGEQTHQTEKPSHGKQTHQTEKPSHGEQTNQTEKPSHGKQTHQTEKPSHGEQTNQTEKPSHGQQTNQTEKPSHGEQTNQTEKPSHGQQTNQTEKPSHGQQTHKTEKPSHGEQTHQTEKPSHGKQTHQTEKPSHGEQTHQTEKPSHGQQTHQTEKPSHGQQTHQTEKPSHGKQTHQTEKPSHGQQTHQTDISQDMQQDHLTNSPSDIRHLPCGGTCNGPCDSLCDGPCPTDQASECILTSSLTDKLKACMPSTDIDANKTSSISKPEVKCEACRSLDASLSGYNSNDTEAGVSYVSSQHPHNQQVFSMVRQACVRSLSSEISPGKDGPGPIFFGDDTIGYALSHTFIIKDSQYSRGFQRRYSIIIAMLDKIYLLNSWPFLVKHIQGIIAELRAKAMKVYEAEQAKNPARSQHMVHRRHMNVRTITPSKPARSLVELTGDKHIFRKLHQTFTWLLKAGGNRLTEKLLEGPPTEDSIIDFEKQEETEEGFVLLTSRKDLSDEQMEDVLSVVTDETDVDVDCPTFKNLRHLLKVFGYTQFHKVAHHVVIGNQVIVRGQRRKIVRSVIDCLKTLLPKGCFKVIYYSNKHQDTWKCNFLGLSLDVELPSHIEHYVVITIHDPSPVEEDSRLSLQDHVFSGYVFTINSPTILPEKGPSVLIRMEYAMMNDNLADSVVDQCLICLKEEWMNKVKVLFKFTKAGGSRSDDDTRELMHIVGAQSEDKVVLQFWRTGLSAQYRHHMLSSAINKT